MADKISLVVLCPGNSFFTDETALEAYLRKAAEFSEKVYLLLPGNISIYNHQATHATNPEKYTRRESLRLKKKRDLVLKKLDLSKFCFLEWDVIDENKVYQSVLHEIRKMYDDNASFREDVNDCTRKCLTCTVARNPGRHFTDEDIPHAANFLLVELALSDAFGSIVGLDEAEYFFLSHTQTYGVIPKFLDGVYKTKPVSKLQYQCIQ